MIKVAVCDDEKFYLSKIVQLVGNTFKNRGVTDYQIDFYESSEQFYETEKLLDYDVIFLDINMPEITGMDIAGKIRKLNSRVLLVFITAFADYAVEGYQMEAVRFVLKDMMAETLPECVDAIINKLAIQTYTKVYTFIEGKRTLTLDSIYYIESQKHKLYFHVMEKNMVKYSLNDKLDNIEKDYLPYGFIRIHKSILVNSHYIESIMNYKVKLITGLQLPVPKLRYQKTKERYYEIKGELQ